MRRTVVDPRFQAMLTNLMVVRGMSQRRLAATAAVSPSYLSEIINGRKGPSIEIAHALDEALGADGRLTGLVTLAARPDDLDQIAAAAANPRHVGAGTITSLGRALVGQRYLDDAMGSAALLGPVDAQMPSITAMVVEATGPQRRDLLHMAAQWAQFAGWLHTSAGDMPGARRWFATGLEWAIGHGDPDLTATILSYQGHVAWLDCHWAPAVDLALAALRDERVYPGQRAYDALQAARGYAALGDTGEAERLLELGNQLAADADAWPGEVPGWQYYRAPWLWSVERGLVQLYLARRDHTRAPGAIASLQAGVDDVPEDYRGADWYAEYVTHLATAYLTGGELDLAAITLSQARTIAEATRSTRVLRMIDGRARRLNAAGRRDILG